MRAPQSLMAPSPDAVLDAAIAASPIASKYAAVADRESAYEKLTARVQAPPAAEAPQQTPAPTAAKKTAAPKEDPGFVSQVVKSSAFKSALRSAGTVLGREITRSIFGTRKR